MGRGKVPFSWEELPGVSKAATIDQRQHLPPNHKLPLPPCRPSQSLRKIMSFEMQNIPLPPSTFQPPLQAVTPRMCSSIKSAKKDDDPFLVAYRECTKGSREASNSSKRGISRPAGLFRKPMSGLLSCKGSCSVRDGNLIRISHSES
ncbi:hypothetical protein SAY86_004237 [Trapa natans]|uniref:Uncharacterized protein n=1 Tax=Trapa natans TaxID=22666 RepID=A0AAN7ME42_TRANT|nr:hypothetical protein SAY86_004237 [Trapa natans]